MATKRTKGPTFLRFVAPIVETLRELGNSGTSGEVADRVLDRLKISEQEQEETTSNGHSRVRNQIGWARFYLAKAGYLDASQRGVWSLTEVGRTAKLDADAVQAMFRDVRKKFPRKAAALDSAADTVEEDEDAETAEEVKDYKVHLLDILRALPPSGFERICQRLLRESGFQQVVVTGKSGDGGIDGHGVLEVNPLVTFKVLFQCKRYGDGNAVTPSQVRDFRGAMQGRADNGEKLVTMFERARMGLKPVQTFEVEQSFFEEFRK
jgi:restriction system protein